MVVMILICICTTCYNFFLAHYLEEPLRTVFTIIIGLLIVPLIFCAYKTIRTANVRTKVSNWIKDAIEVEATVTRQDAKGGSRLEVTFVVYGVEHRQLSKPYGKHKNKVFSKYEGKTVTIFYSPSFDQVLLLK